ncbi:Ig-like domain-containing protein [Lonsdalea quercina]|uniref:Ig-like domain (Group 1) n=1 Tax=Lonsdalea quercina TaxID=71657 RepID=A0A1H3ZQP5_9GAMM|nr:Ig-like domain-containing protein [Lonsdalea quercina]SEA26103.1 Ig-like domain (group 1) [Lonsdalea quercina]
MIIENFTLTPNSAIANGADLVSASAVVMNGNSYVSGEPVVFSITSGSAVFSNGLSSIVVSTNSLGAVSASLVDTIAETVVVEVALQNDASVHSSLAATFTQSSNKTDTLNLLLTVDDAKADGEDQNLVELQTFSGAIPVPSVGVSVALTNGAVFINGLNTADITTDSKGRASLPFTSTTAGKTRLTAYLQDNIVVYGSVTATFVSATPSTDVSLVLNVVSDNAQANGKSVNRVCATVTDNTTLKPLSGQTVMFTITSGSATFDNDSTTYSTTTDSDGNAYASVKDTKVESVTIRAAVGDKTATATVHFSQETTPLNIQRIYNVNQTFPSGGPTVAWNNAQFSMDVSGGSGNYSWSITEGNDVLSVVSSSGHTGVFKFSQSRSSVNPDKEYNIHVSDTDTGETVDYTFTIDLYFTEFGDLYWYTNPNEFPTTNEFNRLLNEWGFMIPYDGWVTDENNGWYWTSEHSSYYYAHAFNVKNGKEGNYNIKNTVCAYAEKY